jgi:hypothetical protein
MTRDAPIKGQGSSYALEAPKMYSRLKEKVDEGIPSGEASSASVAASRLLSNGARAPTRIPR